MGIRREGKVPCPGVVGRVCKTLVFEGSLCRTCSLKNLQLRVEEQDIELLALRRRVAELEALNGIASPVPDEFVREILAMDATTEHADDLLDNVEFMTQLLAEVTGGPTAGCHGGNSHQHY